MKDDDMIDQEEIFQDAIATFGVDHQVLKAKEECTEFVLACLHYEQGRVPITDVIDELADVMIVVEHVRLVLGSAAVDEAVKRKLKKLVRLTAEAKELRGGQRDGASQRK